MRHAHSLDAGPRLDERVWNHVGRPVLFVPLGSTEQHGPHLPLGTDTAVASTVAQLLVARCRSAGRDAASAAALAYGSSGEHQHFAGTISIGHDALALLVLEFGRSACDWAERVVFVNGHGGNVGALSEAVPMLIGEGRAVAWLPCTPSSPGPSGDAHAGRQETSLMLDIAPDTVRLARAEPGNTSPLAELMPRLRDGGVQAVSPNGVLGDPRGASAEEGAALLAAIVEACWSRLAHDDVGANGCLVAPPAEGAER